MTLTISPLFGTRAVPEVESKCFSFLSLAELYKAGKVSRNWFELTSSNDLWKPFFIELKLSNCVENITIKTAVLSDLKKHLSLVNKIVGLIDKDEELASIIDYPSTTLEKFKKMPPLQCSLQVLRGLRKDCTQLFVYLPTKFVRAMANHMDLSEATYQEEFELAATYFYENEKYLPFLNNIIKDPLGPYDAVKTMSATLNLTKFNLTCEKVACICASIVKSHPDLSELFKKTFENGNQFIGPDPIPMTTVIKRKIIPLIDQMGLGVTIDDWVCCGLAPLRK